MTSQWHKLTVRTGVGPDINAQPLRTAVGISLNPTASIWQRDLDRPGEFELYFSPGAEQIDAPALAGLHLEPCNRPPRQGLVLRTGDVGQVDTLWK